MEEAAAGGGDDQFQAETESHGEGKALIGKNVRKKDGKRQIHGNIEGFDPETKLYKVRFEADHVDELKWEEIKNYLPQEISFKRYPQKKKVDTTDADKPAKDGEKTEDRPAQDSSEDKIVTEAQEKDITTAGSETEKAEETLITDTHDNVKVGIAVTVSEVDIENKVEEDVTAVSGAVGEGEAKIVANAEVRTDNMEVDIATGDLGGEEADEEQAVNEQGKVNEEKEKVNGEDAVSEDDDEEVKDAVNEEEDAADEDEGVKDVVNEGQVNEEDDDSLSDSELEMLTRKKKHKKRKHVLTLQRWRGYKKKRKLAKEAKEAEARAQENIPKDGEDIPRNLAEEMEVIPRQKSRTRKLTEVEEMQKKRQKIAQELRNKLKSTPVVVKTKKVVKLDKKTEEVSGGQSQKEEVNSGQPEEGNGENAVAGDEVNVEDTEVNAEEVKEGQNEEVKEGQTEEVNDGQLALTPVVENKVTGSSSSEVKPSPFDRGIKLRGRKLRKVFNGKLYRGEVADYDRRTRFYKICYEDGDEEKLQWKDVGPMLVPFEELHMWDDPDYEPPLKVLSTELEKPIKTKEKKPKLPKLKPVAIKRRR